MRGAQSLSLCDAYPMVLPSKSLIVRRLCRIRSKETVRPSLPTSTSFDAPPSWSRRSVAGSKPVSRVPSFGSVGSWSGPEGPPPHRRTLANFLMVPPRRLTSVPCRSAGVVVVGTSWFSLSVVSHSSRVQSAQSSVRTRYWLLGAGANLRLATALPLSAAGAFAWLVAAASEGNVAACSMNCRTR